MKLRVATFNVENLSSRWRFADVQRGDVTAAMSLAEFDRPHEREAAERSVALTLEDDKRQMTALAIAEARADVLCLQEVDSLRVLEAFFANYVHRMSDIRYGHFKLMEGNDRRGIDVGFAARRSLLRPDQVTVTSHREGTFEQFDVFDRDIAAFGIKPGDRVFNRDCLMVDLDLGHMTLTLFVCHLKSMNNGKADGRPATMPLRRAEARAVRALVQRRFGPDWRRANWIVAGDLNDYSEVIGPLGAVDSKPSPALQVLTEHFGVNPVADLPPHERWTHFHRAWIEDEGRIREEHVQLDYVLLSPALAERGATVEIVRRGLPYRTPLDPRDPDRSIPRLATTADRYPRVGWDRPKASDHCLLAVEIDLPANRRD
ncbi:endonuclease [Alsobacter metallidurans]|uniref:Endonuclease n=1 Tax=Alsobacter metallidurans TaxID=340221 RepID=A0A917I9Y2_9HYPH|nr:endonuclease/exonuclease/phosphatase family protein [Alsobacter metallidurans]GGH27096.1 endonuclease [Alsobacter metallidurans]